jgi:SpoVK/Ycf46/Vps4 family AAA+-type ATPase
MEPTSIKELRTHFLDEISKYKVDISSTDNVAKLYTDNMLIATAYHNLNILDNNSDATNIRNENQYKIQAQDLQQALYSSEGKKCKKFTPITFYEGSKECKVWFNNVIGLADVKKAFYDSFINPLRYPGLYGTIPKGILLYGPPGVGKTYIVKAAMNELQAEGGVNVLFFAPSAGLLKGKYFGESERAIKALFECASEQACDDGEDKS